MTHNCADGQAFFFRKKDSTEKNANTETPSNQDNLDAQGWNPEVREVGIFRCHAAFDWAGAEEQLKVLETLQDEIQRKLRIPHPKEKVELFLFPSLEAWQRFHGKFMQGIPFRRAFFMKPDVILKNEASRGKIYAAISPQIEQDLRHEGTHAILHAALGKPLPIWIDEGLAEYFESPLPPRMNKTWYNQTLTRLQNNQTIPIKKLEKITGMNGMSREAYGDSWAWAVYLIEGPQETREILPEYLQNFAKRFTFPSPFSAISAKIVRETNTQPEICLKNFFMNLDEKAEAEP